MTSPRDRYFLALLLPEPVCTEVHNWKLFFAANFGSRAALRSPPHITLHMPFEWPKERYGHLLRTLRSAAATWAPVAITVDGFGRFAPRVIYLQVAGTPDLLDLQQSLVQTCRTRLGLLHANYRDQAFHPHITVAFRDLRKRDFESAWEAVRHQPVTGRFTADRLWVLKETGNEWQAVEEIEILGFCG